MVGFPVALTNVIPGVTEIKAAHINNLEAKVGIDGSAIVTSLDYLLKNPASVNPGHLHTLAALPSITASAGELNLLDLSGLTAGWVLRATGAAGAAWEALQAGDLPTGINAAKIADGSVSNTVFQYLGGVTSAIQFQLDGKQPVDATLTALAGLIMAQGDLVFATGPDAFALLNKSTAANQFLKNSGADNNPAWASLAESDLPDLSAYARLAGRSGGQTLIGGTGAGENLTLVTTSHATKGAVLLAQNGGNLGIGASTFGISAAMVVAIGAGTAPTTAPADMAQLWVEDINATAGKAGLHMLAESGTGKLVVAGVLIKATAGDPSQVHEGLMCINTNDNNLKMYCEGAWRQLASW